MMLYSRFDQPLWIDLGISKRIKFALISLLVIAEITLFVTALPLVVRLLSGAVLALLLIHFLLDESKPRRLVLGAFGELQLVFADQRVMTCQSHGRLMSAFGIAALRLVEIESGRSHALLVDVSSLDDHARRLAVAARFG